MANPLSLDHFPDPDEIVQTETGEAKRFGDWSASELRAAIERARRAQQENEQKHDVQLEIVATAGPRCPHCGWIHETADDADTGRRSNYRCEHCARLFSRSTPLHQVCVIPQQELRSADYLEWQYRQNEIHGPGPDCDGED